MVVVVAAAAVVVVVVVVARSLHEYRSAVHITTPTA